MSRLGIGLMAKADAGYRNPTVAGATRNDTVGCVSLPLVVASARAGNPGLVGTMNGLVDQTPRREVARSTSAGPLCRRLTWDPRRDLSLHHRIG